MPLLTMPVAVRRADLRDPAMVAAIDAFVLAHPGSTPFHRPAWSLATARGCGQRAHLMIAQHADGTIVGLLPLTEVRSPLFGSALVSAGFAVDGGALVSDAADAAALIDTGWVLAQSLSCPTMELRGGAEPGPGWRRDEETYVGFVRALAGDDAAELKAIPRKQRAEVRKALELPLEVSVGRGAADLAAHHAVYARSVRNLGTPVFPRALFAEVLDAFGEDADILTVRHAGVPVASVLSLYHRGTVYPYWGGGTEAARTLRANDRMYFALMAHARGRGCTRFDFGRSKVGTGAAAFKKNWGFEPAPLAYATRTAAGQPARTINPLDAKYQRKVAAWQRLPLWLANLAGPPIARGLG